MPVGFFFIEVREDRIDPYTTAPIHHNYEDMLIIEIEHLIGSKPVTPIDAFACPLHTGQDAANKERVILTVHNSPGQDGIGTRYQLLFPGLYLILKIVPAEIPQSLTDLSDGPALKFLVYLIVVPRCTPMLIAYRLHDIPHGLFIYQPPGSGSRTCQRSNHPLLIHGTF
jgi:hypothetical protein